MFSNSKIPVENQQEFKEFIKQISCSSLANLKQKPLLLSQQSSQLNNQLSLLAYSEYQSFLRAHESSLVILQQLISLNETVPSILSLINSLFLKIQTLLKSSLKYSQDRQNIALLVLKQDHITELLAIPQLIDTFVLNNHYDEAMDLCVFCQRIRDRYPHIPLLQNITDKVNIAKDRMLNQLISLLSGPVKLPICMKVMGLLKRMDIYSESELKIVFLNQRDSFMNFLLEQIIIPDSAEHLKRYIEISRETFFDILTQYNAIFADTLSATSDSATSSQAILSFYATHVIEELLSIVNKKIVDLTDASSINSIFTQIMYYGMSLGRVGLDFRQVASELFEEVMLRLTSTTLQLGTESFSEKISSLPMGPWQSSGISQDNQILSFPAVAELMNVYFGVFNQIRIIPALSNKRVLFENANNQISEAIKVLEKLGTENQDTWPDLKRIEFEKLCLVFSETFISGVKSGFETVYGTTFKITFQSEHLNTWATNARRRLVIAYQETT